MSSYLPSELDDARADFEAAEHDCARLVDAIRHATHIDDVRALAESIALNGRGDWVAASIAGKSTPGRREATEELAHLRSELAVVVREREYWRAEFYDMHNSLTEEIGRINDERSRLASALLEIATETGAESTDVNTILFTLRERVREWKRDEARAIELQRRYDAATAAWTGRKT